MIERDALVVATYSRRMQLLLSDGGRVDARIKGKRLKPVCGDHVEAQPIPGEPDWLITAIGERRNQLTRPNLRGKVEVLAANIDRLIVMAAATPEPEWSIVDRYLCAAELIDTDAAVVFNKIDIPAADAFEEVLDEYARIGYPALRCSAKTGHKVDAVAALLRDGVSIIVGQSGVGKSSLINRLLKDDRQRVAAVSDKSGEGRHTTVSSVMLQLPEGGAVIDSPGVRDYAPALEPDEVVAGYREIAAAARDCRFANCRHLREPGCAVKAAVDDGTISKRRYDSYRHLLALTTKLMSGQY
ncbi:MAG: ribosome small subunit-dependent GTPase A [Gammaproteobacteria bacterium]|jgi:ribosome biogenesis GTPase|nr:ribosome small subunit-dependent GTPase A [Gammaproteobacteria bacterium]